jgi:hypothetical protein
MRVIVHKERSHHGALPQFTDVDGHGSPGSPGAVASYVCSVQPTIIYAASSAGRT